MGEDNLSVTPEEMEEVKEDFERTKDQMRGIAGALENILSELHSKRMGFALVVFEFGDPKVGNYISNVQRDDMILALRELADRLERKQGVVERGEDNG